MRRTNLKLTLGLFAIVAIGVLLFYRIEFYEEIEESSWSLDAQRNPYLAAELFMQKSGIAVTDVDRLGELESLDSVGTLFFSNANQVQLQRQLEQVLNWLEKGGNVIYAANWTEHDDDLLLRTFEIEVDWAEDDEAEEEPSLSETMREFNRQIEAGKTREQIARDLAQEKISLTRVKFADEIGELEIAFDNDRILTHPRIATGDAGAARYEPFSWSVSDYGVHMMQFEVGEGLLTVVSDPRIWTSYQIDQHDHAYLLWLLSAEVGDFAVLRSVVRETLWGLLKKNAGELMIAAGFLLLFWIWHAGYRFGRLLQRDESRTRALGEYFSSVSHYLWHRRHGDYLVTPLRQRVLRHASLKLTGFANAEPERRYQLIAERCDLTRETVAGAFDGEFSSEASFVKTVRLLKHIEQSL